jgi:hypothetical protein
MDTPNRMKYFAPDAPGIDPLSEEAVTRANTAMRLYRGYMASIEEDLPPGLREFYRTITVSDATLLRLHVDRETESAELLLEADTIPPPDEYAKNAIVTLNYKQLLSFESAIGAASAAGLDGYGDLLNDEIELEEDGIIEHRIVTTQGIELIFRFRDFAFSYLPLGAVGED